MGVEPTKSPRPQRDRFSGLRTRSVLTVNRLGNFHFGNFRSGKVRRSKLVMAKSKLACRRYALSISQLRQFKVADPGVAPGCPGL